MEVTKKKFLNNGIPDEAGDISVSKQTITMMQENDTWGTSERYQQLHVETVGIDYDEKENRDFFFRVTTGGETDEDDLERFWSVEGPEEFVEIFNEIAERTKMKVRWEIKKVFVDEIDSQPTKKLKASKAK